MASIQQRGSKWQVRIKHALLPKPIFATIETEDGAYAYAEQIEALLERGIVPSDLIDEAPRRKSSRLAKIIKSYMATADVAPSDLPILELLIEEVGNDGTTDISARWADAWVSRMKLTQNIAPSTIRKRVGSLARVMDWHIRSTMADGGIAPANPLRMMPRGYSQYSAVEAEKVEKVGKRAKRDVSRDRRLTADDVERIRRALNGEKRPDRERALTAGPELLLFFELIVNTGLRLSEAFKLRIGQFDSEKGVLNVDGSKGERGRIKPRVVPLVPTLRVALREWCDGRVGLMFPFWDGSPEDVKRTSMRLSNRFSTVFDYAQVEDFTEHDLRHEATCRWVEMRDRSGRWMWSEVEVCKIMGWSDTKMFLRYASLRAEDFADRLLG